MSDRCVYIPQGFRHVKEIAQAVISIGSQMGGDPILLLPTVHCYYLGPGIMLYILGKEIQGPGIMFYMLGNEVQTDFASQEKYCAQSYQVCSLAQDKKIPFVG
jgi:hypothetical protein